MITTKRPEDIETLREAGKISKFVLEEALRRCVPGKVLKELDREIGELLAEKGAEPWFPEIDNYPANTCISVNEVWLHGIPDDQALKASDVVSVDIGTKYKGFYIDNCWTVVASEENVTRNDIKAAYTGAGAEIEAFLVVGEEALSNAIKEAQIGKRTGDISSAMQKTVESKGYSVIRDFAGHGVGYSPHEDPQILCYGTPGAGPQLKNFMVLAIEIMYTVGKSETITAKDGWGIITADGKISGMFEHTVLITENGPEILTN